MARKLLVGTRKGAVRARASRPRVAHRARGAARRPRDMVLGEDDGTLHAAQDLGHFGVKMKRSRDGGATWEDRPVPQYPPKPDGEDDVDPTRRHADAVGLEARLGARRHRRATASSGAARFRAALFRSTRRRRFTGGSSTASGTIRTAKSWFGGGADYPGIHSVLVDPRDPDVVRIGVSCGGLWIEHRTRGAVVGLQRPRHARRVHAARSGVRAPRIQDRTASSQCARAPDHLWIQHHNGIFRSTDGGLERAPRSRTRSRRCFGFAVAVHPDDPHTAWFVPGREGSSGATPSTARSWSRARATAAQSFEMLRAGLPQQHAYDVVYRHGLDIDADGATLAFGSTTGNLCAQRETRAISWQNVSALLPPIYCVRFAN